MRGCVQRSQQYLWARDNPQAFRKWVSSLVHGIFGRRRREGPNYYLKVWVLNKVVILCYLFCRSDLSTYKAEVAVSARWNSSEPWGKRQWLNATYLARWTERRSRFHDLLGRRIQLQRFCAVGSTQRGRSYNLSQDYQTSRGKTSSRYDNGRWERISCGTLPLRTPTVTMRHHNLTVW